MYQSVETYIEIVLRLASCNIAHSRIGFWGTGIAKVVIGYIRLSRVAISFELDDQIERYIPV